MTKKELVQYVEDHRDELITMTSQLIQIKSENPTGTQRDVVDFVETFLKDAGIEYKETGCNPDYPCVVAGYGKDMGFFPDHKWPCRCSACGGFKPVGV